MDKQPLQNFFISTYLLSEQSINIMVEKYEISCLDKGDLFKEKQVFTEAKNHKPDMLSSYSK